MERQAVVGADEHEEGEVDEVDQGDEGNEGDVSAPEVMREADMAMNHAKRMGGDRVEVFRPSLQSSGASRVELEADLRKALNTDGITVYYQPIVRLADRSIAGFEVLARCSASL